MVADDNVVVFTEDRVRALSGATYAQIRYWGRDLVPPSVHHQVNRRSETRLYDFDGVLTIMILADLKARGHSLQHLRQIAQHVRQRGLRFSELRFAISGKRVHFQGPDGEWEDADRSQHLDPSVVPLEPIRARVRDSIRRDPSTVGRTERRRGAMGSKVLVAGTRVPVATLRRYVNNGFSTERILESFPAITREDVDTLRVSA